MTASYFYLHNLARITLEAEAKTKNNKKANLATNFTGHYAFTL